MLSKIKSFKELLSMKVLLNKQILLHIKRIETNKKPVEEYLRQMYINKKRLIVK